MLIDEVCDLLLPAAAGRRVAEVRIGLGYTAVQLDDGCCGLAYTLRDDIQSGCCVIGAAGTLAGRPASELAAWAKSLDSIHAAVGLATLNALVEKPLDAVETDLLTLLPVGPDDVIGMVGYFGPLVEPLRKRCRALHILERHPGAESGLLPESAAGEVLPRCQIVILSATTLLNRTLDGLLQLCRNAREVAILGPSTPLLPEVFATRGATLLSGVHVIDPERALRIVSEGGGTRQLGEAVKKLTVRLPRHREASE
jgi:uncharacterized protein (DUF4213/DUF364 family)